MQQYIGHVIRADQWQGVESEMWDLPALTCEYRLKGGNIAVFWYFGYHHLVFSGIHDNT